MKLFTILWLFLYPALIYSQNANITFQADTTINITLYGEIDNAVNRTNPIDTIQLAPNIPVHHKINLIDFSYLHIQYSSGIYCTLLVFPGNKITINYSNNKIKFTGDNQEGQILLNKYFSLGLAIYISKYSNEWEKYINNDIEYKALINAMQKDTILLHEHFNQIESLAKNLKVSQKFADIAKENLNLFKQAYNIQSLRTLLNVPKYETKTKKDSLSITTTIDSLFCLFPNKDPQFIAKVAKQYFGSNYLVQYFYHHFKNNQAEADYNHFYTLSPYMHAPLELQSGLIGRGITSDIKYGTDNNLQEKCIHFIECYPNSDYTAILKKQLKETTFNPTINITTIDNISNLSELADVKQLKGKYILVDLWATWCIPCRKEFEFSGSLDKLIKSFKDLTLIYISLDKGTNLQKWTEIAQKYKLEGIHIIANKKLQDDIRLKVFNATKDNILLPQEFTIKDNIIEGSSITIPRYFLLDTKGEVIYCNLPRPNNMEHLKSELEEIFNKI